MSRRAPGREPSARPHFSLCPWSFRPAAAFAARRRPPTSPPHRATPTSQATEDVKTEDVKPETASEIAGPQKPAVNSAIRAALTRAAAQPMSADQQVVLRAVDAFYAEHGDAPIFFAAGGWTIAGARRVRPAAKGPRGRARPARLARLLARRGAGFRARHRRSRAGPGGRGLCFPGQRRPDRADAHQQADRPPAGGRSRRESAGGNGGRAGRGRATGDPTIPRIQTIAPCAKSWRACAKARLSSPPASPQARSDAPATRAPPSPPP